MSQVTSLIFSGCPNIKEKKGACAGHLILEAIEIALIVIAATNVLGLPPLGMGLFTGFSAFALLITSVSCCCWRRRQAINEGGAQALFNHARSAYMLEHVNVNTEKLKCKIDIKYRDNPLPDRKKEVFNDFGTLQASLREFVDKTKKSVLDHLLLFQYDVNRLEFVQFTLIGKQQGASTYWIAKFTLRLDQNTGKVVDDPNPQQMTNALPDDQGTFAKPFQMLGITNGVQQLDAQGNFV